MPPGAGGAPRLSVEEFLDVVAAPGRMDDMRHAEVRGGAQRVLVGGHGPPATSTEFNVTPPPPPPHNAVGPHARAPAQVVYSHLETMLRSYKSDEQAETLCKGLHELGFWVCLPHVVVERAYADRNVPDRYCTVALMAENRHLIKVRAPPASEARARGA